MIKKTFQNKGVDYASQLALANILDLEKVIDWNINNRIFLFRLSSDLFPWMSEYEFYQLPDIGEIKSVLRRIGRKAETHHLRLTFHPGQFNVLASANPSVVSKTIKELRQHAEIMDMIGLPVTPFAKINIHVGGSYGEKEAALQRFIDNFWQLPPAVQGRLTVENDDKANLFSVNDLIMIYHETGIPIVFDYHHHSFCTGGLSEQQALQIAVSTWPENITPIVHYSSTRKLEDSDASETSHADFIYHQINNYGFDVDIMLEAKAKEVALFRYLEQFHS